MLIRFRKLFYIPHKYSASLVFYDWVRIFNYTISNGIHIY